MSVIHHRRQPRQPRFSDEFIKTRGITKELALLAAYITDRRLYCQQAGLLPAGAMILNVIIPQLARGYIVAAVYWFATFDRTRACDVFDIFLLIQCFETSKFRFNAIPKVFKLKFLLPYLYYTFAFLFLSFYYVLDQSFQVFLFVTFIDQNSKFISRTPRFMFKQSQVSLIHYNLVSFIYYRKVGS